MKKICCEDDSGCQAQLAYINNFGAKGSWVFVCAKGYYNNIIALAPNATLLTTLHLLIREHQAKSEKTWDSAQRNKMNHISHSHSTFCQCTKGIRLQLQSAVQKKLAVGRFLLLCQSIQRIKMHLILAGWRFKTSSCVFNINFLRFTFPPKSKAKQKTLRKPKTKQKKTSQEDVTKYECEGLILLSCTLYFTTQQSCVNVTAIFILEVSNIWPAGQIQPAELLYPAYWQLPEVGAVARGACHRIQGHCAQVDTALSDRRTSKDCADTASLALRLLALLLQALLLSKLLSPLVPHLPTSTASPTTATPCPRPNPAHEEA